MGFGIAYRVWGNYACFTRPEMKVERVSYDMITPSAARGIIEAVYWKPSIRWIIDKIHVLNDIEFTNIRRNEVTDKVSTNIVKQMMKKKKGELFYLSSNEKRQQRAGLILKNVDYVIEAHFDMLKNTNETDDNEKKHYNMVCRRLQKGQYHHAPYLGTREFGAKIALIEHAEIPQSVISGKIDLGWMLYDMDYSDQENIQPQFFKAELINGILDLDQLSLAR